ncbi:MAG: GAF domain-containing sensor histidine kinase [bacterium]|nr:GAF domain-containing sensor histidine kinase [bacterium]
MISADKLLAFLKLQQLVLDTEDSKTLFPLLMPQVLATLNSVGWSYEFVAAVFIDNEDKPQQSFCVDVHWDQNSLSSCPAIVDLNKLFAAESLWKKELVLGKAILSPDINELIAPSYPGIALTKSLLVSPIHFSKKLVGAMIMASTRPTTEINQEEFESVELIAALISLAFKIYDTQNSLTQVTQEIYKMNVQLHQLDKLKDDFVSVASHELRTPMTAIRSYTWMALHRSDVPLSEKLKKYLDRTLLSTERLINLVNDMLNVSRIEAGTIEIRPAPFDMVQLVDEVIAEVGLKASERMIHLNVLKTQLPEVFADQDKVHQVLLNLIGNALKFVPADGEITVSFISDGKVLETLVKDTGVGISKDDLPRLFQKFGRLDNSYVAAATSGGTGLGLFISRSLVELMKGRIWVSSEGVGKGTTFTFSLPVASKEVLAQAEKYTTKVTGEVKHLEPVAI